MFLGCHSPSEITTNVTPEIDHTMYNQEITFESTDTLIESLKEQYNQGGLASLRDWVNSNFQPKTKINIARDLTNLSKIDSRIIYDRAIMQLDQQGNETNFYYLEPINQDAFSADLFLSIRLNFIPEPLEVLIYVE